MTVAGEFTSGRKATQLDVARRAEVSRSLVSIVMRGAPGASPEATERILAAAEELGYRPDVRARSLAGQRSRVIGVMFGVAAGTFPFELLDSLFAAAEDHGHSLIMAPLTRTRDEARAAEALQDFRFDGLVMLSPPTPHPLLAGRIPMAVVGWHVDHPEVDVIRTSDQEGIWGVVDHLVALGHRRIAHLDGGQIAIAAARRTAYEDRMRFHGLGRQIQVASGGQGQLDGIRGTRELLADGEPPTGLVAYNDDTAVAAIGVLNQHGLAVPERVSVTGFDDSAVLAVSPVPVTTVVQHADQMGRLAIERVVARVTQRRVVDREVVLPAELRIRASTAVAASSD